MVIWWMGFPVHKSQIFPGCRSGTLKKLLLDRNPVDVVTPISVDGRNPANPPVTHEAPMEKWGDSPGINWLQDFCSINSNLDFVRVLWTLPTSLPALVHQQYVILLNLWGSWGGRLNIAENRSVFFFRRGDLFIEWMLRGPLSCISQKLVAWWTGQKQIPEVSSRIFHLN